MANIAMALKGELILLEDTHQWYKDLVTIGWGNESQIYNDCLGGSKTIISQDEQVQYIPPTAMSCPYCRQRNLPDALECRKCGAPLD